MIRKEICGSNGAKLVLHIDGETVKAHWIHDDFAQPGEFAANDFIELGQTLSAIEQGEARDAEKLLDMPSMAEAMLNSMNKAGGAK